MSALETKIIKQEEKGNFTRFAIEPLERGFGHTLGNSLRRVLLSQIAGAAITKIKMAGVVHQFSTIPGVREDTIELILNLKKINFAMIKKSPLIVTLNATGPGEVRAGQLQCPTGIEVVNKDWVVANLADKKTKLEMEITIEYGKGYRLSETASSLGTILVDANFSPIERIDFRVEDARVGRLTDLDRLIIEIWTKGTVNAQKVLEQAAAILAEQFTNLTSGMPVEEVGEAPAVQVKTNFSKKVGEETIYLEELNLPTRTINTLKKAGIETVADVESQGSEGLSKIKHVGPKTVETILKKVKKIKNKEE